MQLLRTGGQVLQSHILIAEVMEKDGLMILFWSQQDSNLRLLACIQE